MFISRVLLPGFLVSILLTLCSSPAFSHNVQTSLSHPPISKTFSLKSYHQGKEELMLYSYPAVIHQSQDLHLLTQNKKGTKKRATKIKKTRKKKPATKKSRKKPRSKGKVSKKKSTKKKKAGKLKSGKKKSTKKKKASKRKARKKTSTKKKKAGKSKSQRKR